MGSVRVDEDRRKTRSRIGKRGALFLFPSSGFCSLFLIGCWQELASSVHIRARWGHTLLLLLAHDRRRILLGFLVLGTGHGVLCFLLGQVSDRIKASGIM